MRYYTVKAEVYFEMTGDAITLTFDIPEIDSNGKPDEGFINDTIMENLSIIPLSISDAKEG